MSQELQTLDQNTIAKLVLNGDMKGLTDQQKIEYYSYRCQQAGLDPAAQPFNILLLNGKMILYANASASQQLTGIHKLSHQITGRELTDGVYCVFCRVASPDGRSTENMGAVTVEGLKGEAKANAMLKATTKAIRRTVLAHMGLGIMDETEVETEVETIPGAVHGALTMVAPEPAPATTNGWSIDEMEEFETTSARAYAAFKAGGKPEAYDLWLAKWRANKAKDPAEQVLTKMAAFVAKLEAAAAQKAA